MNLDISGHHLPVTQALHDHTIEKLEHVLKHALDHVIGVTIRFAGKRKCGVTQKASVIVQLKGRTITVEQWMSKTVTDFYKVVTLLMRKLDRAINESKLKLRQGGDMTYRARHRKYGVAMA